MKRKKNLYEELYKIENISNAFDEVCRNTKNKIKVAKLKEHRAIYISRIHDILINHNYVVREI